MLRVSAMKPSRVPQSALLRCLWVYASSEAFLLSAATTCIVLSSIVQLAIPVVAKRVLGDDATGPSDNSAAVDGDDHNLRETFWTSSHGRICQDCALFLAAVILFHCVSFWGHCFAHNATIKVSHRMMSAGLTALCCAPWEAISHRNPTEWTHVITTASKVVGETCASVITELFSSVITAVGIAVVVCLLSWELTCFFVFVVAASQTFSHFYAQSFHAPSAAQHAKDESRLSSLLCNAAQRSAAVRIFGSPAMTFFSVKFAERCHIAFRSGSELNSKIHLHGAISSAITNCMFVSMIGISVYLKQMGRLTLVDVGLFFFYMKQLLDRVLSVAAEVRRLSVMLEKASEFVQLLQCSTTMTDVGGRRGLMVRPPDLFTMSASVVPSVELDDVYFAYALSADAAPQAGDPLPVTRGAPSVSSRLDGITLNIKAGEFVCLVGASGCGKSTVLKIIAGLLKPSRGCVRTCTSVALLEQTPSIVLGTILENITLGNPTASMTDVVAAAKRAGCHDFVSILPSGYHTIIDNADHAQFSGGQLQRICVARVFLTAAKLILLDEPTTGLDAAASKAVLDSAIALNGEGRTVVFASHDDAVIRRADRVIELRSPEE